MSMIGPSVATITIWYVMILYIVTTIFQRIVVFIPLVAENLTLSVKVNIMRSIVDIFLWTRSTQFLVVIIVELLGKELIKLRFVIRTILVVPLTV